MGRRSAASAARAPARLRAGHVLDVIERAYDVHADDDAWVEGVAQACAPWLDTGAGVHAFRFDLGTGAVGSPALVGGDEAWQGAWRSTWWDGFMCKLSVETLRAMAAFGPVSHTTDLWAATAAQIPTFEELLTRGGRRALASIGASTAGMRYPDSLNVAAADASGLGVALCANRGAVARRPVARETRQIVGRIVAHLAAGVRLRARVGATRSLVADADAIVDGRGALLHLAPRAELARAALRDAAADVMRARRRPPGDDDPSALLSLWRALYAGEYSVLETFDTDGRRYVVARANRPEPPRAMRSEALSERDRRVLVMFGNGCANALIAYQLGISSSAVAASLARARRVLGVASSVELVSAARRLAQGDA